MTTSSFLVRIYRVAAEDPDRLVGQVELLDGSGTSLSFADATELTAILHASCTRHSRRSPKARLVKGA